ncbi:hypothetical protein HJC99_00585 [Candidatus Saccharibacteria bacterium]|nr:hypothetical protein [Candidatus Saccharibacteria bacterium]
MVTKVSPQIVYGLSDLTEALLAQHWRSGQPLRLRPFGGEAELAFITGINGDTWHGCLYRRTFRLTRERTSRWTLATDSPQADSAHLEAFEHWCSLNLDRRVLVNHLLERHPDIAAGSDLESLDLATLYLIHKAAHNTTSDPHPLRDCSS